MSDWSDGFPKDITKDYYSFWNKSRIGFTGTEYSLSELFVLPDLTGPDGYLVDIEKIFADIASGEKSLLAIKGIAGSGKTSLISYLCNSPIVSDTDTGIMVWTLPKSKDLIRIVMGECYRYAEENEKKRMILVFENTMGSRINLEEIYNTISQRQETWYPHISVIITYRDNEAISPYSFIETLSIQPFSKEKIISFIKKYSAFDNEISAYYETAISLIHRFGTETIGNPVILTLTLKLSQKTDISTAEDIYSSLIGTRIGKQTGYLLETIAFLMFTMQTDRIPEESLYCYLKHLDDKNQENDRLDLESKDIKASLKESCIFEDTHISFTHKSLYDYSLASYLATQLYRLYRHKHDKDAIRQLYTLFKTDKFDKTTIAFFESRIKNNDNVPLITLVKQIEQLVSMYLIGELRPQLYAYRQNVQISFLPQFQEEMTLFYNLITLYHAVLKTNGSKRMFEQSSYAADAFMNYLRLFSVFGDENELDLSGLDFSNHDFSGIVLKKINLSECELKNCTFKYSKLENVILKGADLHSSDLSCTQLQNIDLSYANMQTASCAESIILNSSLYSSNLKATDLCRCSFKHVKCQNSNFHLANLDYAICADGSFDGCNFSNSSLRNAVFKNSSFEGATFTDAILE